MRCSHPWERRALQQQQGTGHLPHNLALGFRVPEPCSAEQTYLTSWTGSSFWEVS